MPTHLICAYLAHVYHAPRTGGGVMIHSSCLENALQIRASTRLPLDRRGPTMLRWVSLDGNTWTSLVGARGMVGLAPPHSRAAEEADGGRWWTRENCCGHRSSLMSSTLG
jgi:hypothetical protein